MGRLELQRKDNKIDELERLLHHSEEAGSQNEVSLASSTWQQGYVVFESRCSLFSRSECDRTHTLK